MTRPLWTKGGMLGGCPTKDCSPAVWGKFRAEFYRTPGEENSSMEPVGQIAGKPTSQEQVPYWRTPRGYIYWLFGLGPEGE